MSTIPFREVAEDLELVGLVWHPEIGDEVSNRVEPSNISVLVDTRGLTPRELRSAYIWLPTVEQMVFQLEARQAILCHTGLDLENAALHYKTVIRSPYGEFQAVGNSLRLSVAIGLRELLASRNPEDGSIH